MIDNHDIIAAPATATGGAISVVRVSGEGSVECCDRIFRGRMRLADSAPGTVRHGCIVDGDRVVDDALVSVFRAPHSYTGEDSVEISVHGSRYIVSEVLRLLLGCGARMASPGEFTIRAYLAGKMDLSQAEAVADMIASDSKAAHALASTQMNGGYSASLQALRTQLLDASSLLELELDFSEEDVEFADRSELTSMIERLLDKVRGLVGSFSTGNAIKEGVAVAIVGRPNVGKSTLLNRLVGDERAITSDVAGTTRDTVEACCDIDGVRFRFIDTAGLRATDDEIERMGIERTRKAVADANIIISMSEGEYSRDMVDVSDDQMLVEVVNKADLLPDDARDGDDGTLYISAKSGEGVDELIYRIRSAVDTRMVYAGETVVSNARHCDALLRSATALERSLDALRCGLSNELLSEELREVLNALGEITGEVTSDDILQNIFSKFCIGK